MCINPTATPLSSPGSVLAPLASFSRAGLERWPAPPEHHVSCRPRRVLAAPGPAATGPPGPGHLLAAQPAVPGNTALRSTF